MPERIEAELDPQTDERFRVRCLQGGEGLIYADQIKKLLLHWSQWETGEISPKHCPSFLSGVTKGLLETFVAIRKLFWSLWA